MIDQAAWDSWVAANTDPYGGACVRFAEQWADEMEKRMTPTDAPSVVGVADCADAAMREVDARPGFGVTGFMYGAAVAMLARCWAHGEALRRWHNLAVQIGDEGARANAEGGTLNPALLRVGVRA